MVERDSWEEPPRARGNFFERQEGEVRPPGEEVKEEGKRSERRRKSLIKIAVQIIDQISLYYLL